MRALALTLAAVAAVSACGGSSGGPQTAPPVSSSPVAAATPTPTGIDAPGPEGAAAFAKFFYAEIDRAYQKKDPEIVRALILPSCKTCELYIRTITRLRDKNEQFTGGGFKINFAVAPADTGGNSAARVDVGYDFGAGIFYDAAGKVIQRQPALRNVEEQVALSRVADAWRVVTVRRVVKG
jgi:hypothetical protein